MPLSNRQYRLAARPVGIPKPSDWNLTSETVSEPADDQILIKVLQLSLDPAMPGWMKEGKSYIALVGRGEVMGAGGRDNCDFAGQTDRAQNILRSNELEI